jgi:hypothetical protein
MVWSRQVDGSLLVRLRIPAERGEQLLAGIQTELDATAAADVAGGPAEPSDAHAARDEVTPRAAEHIPPARSSNPSPPRLDALLDLVTGHHHADPPPCRATSPRPTRYIDGTRSTRTRRLVGGGVV